jgi:hypothetical protein
MTMTMVSGSRPPRALALALLALAGCAQGPFLLAGSCRSGPPWCDVSAALPAAGEGESIEEVDVATRPPERPERGRAERDDAASSGLSWGVRAVYFHPEGGDPAFEPAFGGGVALAMQGAGSRTALELSLGLVSTESRPSAGPGQEASLVAGQALVLMGPGRGRRGGAYLALGASVLSESADAGAASESALGGSADAGAGVLVGGRVDLRGVWSAWLGSNNVTSSLAVSLGLRF